MDSTKKLLKMAALTAVALIIFMVEAQIPVPVPVPGIKLGFANIITLFALFYGTPGEKNALTRRDVFLILLCRVIMGAVFTGRFVAFIYSLTGGVFSFAVMAALRPRFAKKQIRYCAALGAVAHNAAQIAAAVFILGTASVAAYLPVLTAAGIVTGLFTGLITEFILGRVR